MSWLKLYRENAHMKTRIIITDEEHPFPLPPKDCIVPILQNGGGTTVDEEGKIWAYW